MSRLERTVLERIRDQAGKLVKAFDKATEDGATCHYRHALIRACLVVARTMAEELAGSEKACALGTYDMISYLLWCLIERLHDLEVEPEELLELMKMAELAAHKLKVEEACRNREDPPERVHAEDA